jgi:hypothetical protein
VAVVHRELAFVQSIENLLHGHEPRVLHVLEDVQNRFNDKLG